MLAQEIHQCLRLLSAPVFASDINMVMDDFDAGVKVSFDTFIVEPNCQVLRLVFAD
jgi:hypothetical protein